MVVHLGVRHSHPGIHDSHEPLWNLGHFGCGGRLSRGEEASLGTLRLAHGLHPTRRSRCEGGCFLCRDCLRPGSAPDRRDVVRDQRSRIRLLSSRPQEECFPADRVGLNAECGRRLSNAFTCGIVWSTLLPRYLTRRRAALLAACIGTRTRQNGAPNPYYRCTKSSPDEAPCACCRSWPQLSP